MRLQVVFCRCNNHISHSVIRTAGHASICTIIIWASCEVDIYAIFNMRNILLIENFNTIYLCTRHDIRPPVCKIMLNVIHNFLYATNDTYIYIFFLCTRHEFGSPECEKVLNVLHISIM